MTVEHIEYIAKVAMRITDPMERAEWYHFMTTPLRLDDEPIEVEPPAKDRVKKKQK